MSTDAEEFELNVSGVPELTALGKRIEFLRLERRLSKRVLAQRAGTSRQQLWRVMTGKSELTSSLCARLAEVLEIDSRALRDAAFDTGDAHGDSAHTERSSAALARRNHSIETQVVGARTLVPLTVAPDSTQPRVTLEDYVAAPDGLERTFETMPSSDDGRRLKRAMLNAIEDIAATRAIKLPHAFFDLRRRVVNGER